MAMEEALKMPVYVSPDAQLTGALGAALLAYEEAVNLEFANPA